MATARSLPKTSASTRLPATFLEIRRLFDAFDWLTMARQVEQEALTCVAIVGPVNSGKSTLFNTLKGRELSPVTAVPGTTRALLHEQWGPFTMIDTPGFGEVDGVDRANIALEGIRTADVIVLVLDLVAGVRHADYDLLQRLRAMGKPLVVVLNKIDLLEKEQDLVIAHARDKLGEPDAVPISAKKGTNISRLLLPRLIDAHPALAVSVGRALPAYRREAANKVIRRASVFSAAAGAEPIPAVDIPLLLAIQAQMVLRIAAIYGEPINAQHAKELVATIVGGVAVRTLAREGAKLIPGLGWVMAAGIASTGTWAMGRVAVQYFAHGRELDVEQLRSLYRRRLRERRKSLEAEVQAGR